MRLSRLVVLPPLSENVYIVADEESPDCLIVDPGGEGNRILDEVERLGLKVKVMVCTHGHVDHVGAVAMIKDATGASHAIHSRDLPLLKNAAAAPLARLIPEFREPPPPDRELKDGDVIEVGNLRFTVLETPGHTPGGISLYGNGVVFSGDTLFAGSIGRSDNPGGNKQNLTTSILSKLFPLPEETRVLPGHGPETTIGLEKKTNPFVRWVESQRQGESGPPGASRERP